MLKISVKIRDVICPRTIEDLFETYFEAFGSVYFIYKINTDTNETHIINLLTKNKVEIEASYVIESLRDKIYLYIGKQKEYENYLKHKDDKS